MKRVIKRFCGEDGFSVFEVVIAASILFFAITAILGLVGATTDMGINARRRNLVTNAIASRMERYRSLPFERIELYPTGDILPNETITMEQYTVTLNTQVRSGPDGTKEIRMTATVTTAGRPPVMTSASTYIRDRDVDFAALAMSSGKPIGRYGPSTPPKDSVVFDDQVVGGGPGSLRFHIIGQASDPSDNITEMSLNLGTGGQLKDSPFSTAIPALFNNYPAPASSREEYFTWHTRQESPQVGDGWQFVELIVKNQDNLSSTTRRRFYVDNYPPETPTSLTATAPTSDVYNRLAWNRCRDGSESVAAWYDLEVWELTTDSGSLPAASTVYQQVTGVNKDVPTIGFSRYHAAVKSVSTRGLSAGSFHLTPRPFVSRPLASGENTYTFTLAGANRTDRTHTRLSVETPRFPVLGKVVYRLYRRKGGVPGGETLLASATRELTPTVQYTYSDLVTYVGNKQVAYVPYYYLVSAEFRPTGYGSTGASETVWSNRLGPTNTSAVLTPLPVEGW